RDRVGPGTPTRAGVVKELLRNAGAPRCAVGAIARRGSDLHGATDGLSLAPGHGFSDFGIGRERPARRPPALAHHPPGCLLQRTASDPKLSKGLRGTRLLAGVLRGCYQE